MTDELYRYRLAGADDLPFIMRSWLESYGRGSPHTVLIPKPMFFAGHRKVVEALLRDPSCQTWVACDAEDPSILLGFISGEPPTHAHYVYVKRAFRRQGIARGLADALGLRGEILASHWTYDAQRLDLHTRSLLFNPYIRELMT